MITLKDVESIHAVLIDRFGGSKGIRDLGILESAINRPFQTFDQNELYPLPVDKAAAIFESIISNHPFIDGNKRTAYVLMRLILLENGIDIYANENEKYEFVISSAKGEMKFNQIREWLVGRTRQGNDPQLHK
ncbi:type II toxin-antitoxin system death-on-curing family toxin [Chryseolinea sp. H1M3-3]|uniref:type II toxin-antitoxin system death-on-curing family toxin n=1 Tax=Chryseolinea sp. H1M3-3 TaxID=3034144 RepID=UPI0023EB3DA0|nr:type II toxin-antitoxin system death-on-curing family toxin [Chryseolinea sp. H1M3-3]